MENQETLEPQQKLENKQLINQELPPQPVKNNNLLLIILSLICLVSISLAGFFGYKYYQEKQIIEPAPTQTSMVMEEKTPIPTMDHMKGWKNFKNEKLSYNIKYPNDWPTIRSILNEDKIQGLSVSLHPNYPNDPNGPPYIKIKASTNETKESYNLKLKSRPNAEKVLVDSYYAVSEKQNVEPEPKTVFTKKGYLYTLFIFNSDLNNSYDISCYESIDNKNLCANVLSTLEFVNKESKDSTSKGTVNGKICYPSSYVPEGYILAKNVKTNNIKSIYFAGVPPEKQNYSIKLDPGKYVFSYGDKHKQVSGLYTSCAISADDCSSLKSHQLIEVEVIAGQIVQDIDLCDYYYQPNQKPDF